MGLVVSRPHVFAAPLGFACACVVAGIECALVALRMCAFKGTVAPMRNRRAAVAQTRGIQVPTHRDAFYPAMDGKGFCFYRFLGSQPENFSASGLVKRSRTTAFACSGGCRPRKIDIPLSMRIRV